VRRCSSLIKVKSNFVKCSIQNKVRSQATPATSGLSKSLTSSSPEMFHRSRFQVIINPCAPSCNNTPTDHINLGYAGYIKGVKSENVYG